MKEHAECLRVAEMKMRDGAYIWTWDPRRDVRGCQRSPQLLRDWPLLCKRCSDRVEEQHSMPAHRLVRDSSFSMSRVLLLAPRSTRNRSYENRDPENLSNTRM